MDAQAIAQNATKGKPQRKKSTPRDSDLWYERYPRRFREATSKMPLELRGVYGLVIDLYFEHGAPLPDSDQWIACGLYCDVRKWKHIRTALFAAKKLYIGGDGLIHNELADELLAVRKARLLVENEPAPPQGKRLGRGATPASTSGTTSGGTGTDLSRKHNEINGGVGDINRVHRQRLESPSSNQSPSKYVHKKSGGIDCDGGKVAINTAVLVAATVAGFSMEDARKPIPMPLDPAHGGAVRISKKDRLAIEALGGDVEELFDRAMEQKAKVKAQGGRPIGNVVRYMIGCAKSDFDEKNGTLLGIANEIITGNKHARQVALVKATVGKSMTDHKSPFRSRSNAPKSNGAALVAALRRSAA